MRFVALCSATSFLSCTKPDLPTYGEVPGFTLTDQNNETVTQDSLRGHVTVVNFIFTSCQATCPMLTQQMRNLREGWDTAKVHSLSITVDPERDTPARLAEYAAKFDADWPFLTGDKADVEALVLKGFKTSMGQMPTGGGLFELVHGERFVLVDTEGKIRGFYEMSSAGRNALNAAARRLSPSD